MSGSRASGGLALALILVGMALQGALTPASATFIPDPVAVTRGGTGATSASAARVNFGLPSTPSTGMIDLALRSPVFMGQYGYLTARTASNSLDGDGLYAAVAETFSTWTNAPTSGGPSSSLASAITLNSNAGWIGPNLISAIQGDNLPLWVLKFQIEDTTDVRVIACLGRNSGFANYLDATNPTVDRYCGIQFDTSAGDTNWMWVEDDATTQTRTSTGVAPGVGTVYWLEVAVNALNSIVLTLRDSTGATLSTRTVTSSPFGATSGIACVLGIQNLFTVDAKATTTYVSTIVLRTGVP